MTCHTCQQGVEVIVDNLYGRRSFRCGCGVISRREPPPPEPKATGRNGFMLKGVFYGTCRNPACASEFESHWARPTCERVECLEWVKLERHGRTPARKLGGVKDGLYHGTCANPECGEPFTSQHARKTCGRRECYLAAKNANESLVGETCECGTVYFTRAAYPAAACARCTKRERMARYRLNLKQRKAS